MNDSSPTSRSAIIPFASIRAGVAQLVEYELPKLGVAGSSPAARSIFPSRGLRTTASGTKRKDKE